MKYRLLLLCLSILVLMFTGCSSSQQSQQLAEQQARLDADQAAVSEQAEAARQALAVAEQTLAAAEDARIAAEQAAKQAKSAEASRLAAEAKVKAEAERAKAIEEQKLAAQKAAEQARAAEEARVAAQQARSAARQKTKAQTFNLTAGTPINVITSSEISTKADKTGDVFSVVLNEDITSGNTVIARRGSAVKGVITESDPGGRVKGVATISLTLTTITLADGSEVLVKTGGYEKEAPSSVGKDVAKTGIGAGIGAAIGAIAGGAKGAAIGAGIGGAAGAGTALATRGDPAVIAPETPITFNLSAPVSINLQQDSGRR
jgi:chemotaxis protein histidine kinase CheA